MNKKNFQIILGIALLIAITFAFGLVRNQSASDPNNVFGLQRPNFVGVAHADTNAIASFLDDEARHRRLYPNDWTHQFIDCKGWLPHHRSRDSRLYNRIRWDPGLFRRSRPPCLCSQRWLGPGLLLQYRTGLISWIYAIMTGLKSAPPSLKMRSTKF